MVFHLDVEPNIVQVIVRAEGDGIVGEIFRDVHPGDQFFGIQYDERRCRWINVSGCTILDCEGGGLLLEETERALVTGCAIRSAGADVPAIVVKKGRGNVLANNLVSGAVRIDEGAADVRDADPSPVEE